MDIEKLKRDLSNLLNELAPFIDEHSLERVRYFIEYNEIKIGVEFLCEYVYEDDITLDNKLVLRINEYCESLGIENIYWLDLNEDKPDNI